MATFIVKGSATTNVTANDLGGAVFVRCVATANAQTLTLKEDGGTVTIGTVYLHLEGDEAIIEKHPTDEITFSGSVAAVGSPRS